MWTIAEVIWIKKTRKKKEVDVKSLLKNLEKEGFPMVYRNFSSKKRKGK